MIEELLRDFYLGFIRIHIPRHSRLGALVEKGYLSSRRQTVGGMARRCCRAAPLGERELKEASRQAGELLREITEASS